MLKKKNDILEIFGSYKDEKFILQKQDIEKDYTNLVGKSLNTRSYAKKSLLRYIPQNRLYANELLSFLREISFIDQEFFVDKPISDIKYYYLNSLNNNFFNLFNNQLNYVLANYFAKSETRKDNINRFLSDLLMVLLIKKLFYQNANK